ncbi:alpha/beta fold hydrolase [Rhodococcus sp. As11]|uniref:alpha/beta fold hydrolase n=1 Tax=Rhodococcus sp. As11 TaxID=3029189 RepID=UPI003B789052
MSHVVLVHGAWAGSWVWDTLLEPLRRAGYVPHPLALPGVGSWGADDVTLDDVATVVADRVAGLDGPVILVGHSGGGIVVTQVAEMLPERIAGVAYVAGMMLPSGVDFGMLCDGIGLEPPVGISRWLEPTGDGRGTIVPPEAGAAVFFHEAHAADAIGAARRLVPQLETARLMAPTWTPERFGRLPRLYIEATLDHSVPVVTQREMQHLTPGAQVVSLESDHAPPLSARDDLAVALVDWCTERVRT